MVQNTEDFVENQPAAVDITLLISTEAALLHRANKGRDGGGSAGHFAARCWRKRAGW